MKFLCDLITCKFTWEVFFEHFISSRIHVFFLQSNYNSMFFYIPLLFRSYNLKSLSWTVRSVTQYRVGSHGGWRCRISRSSEARRRRPKGKAPRGQWMDGRIDLGRRRRRRLSLTIAFPSDAMHAVSLRSIDRWMHALPAVSIGSEISTCKGDRSMQLTFRIVKTASAAARMAC
mgnify:CR=1 FL=1